MPYDGRELTAFQSTKLLIPMEIVVSLDEPPYERILDVDASPSPGKAPDRSGPPGSGGPGYPPSPGIEEVKFADDDPVEEDRGKEVSSEFFNEHEDEITDEVLRKDQKRHSAARTPRGI